MPRLLQINATANWGSTGRIAEQIGLAAMTRGWDSYIAYGRNLNDSKSSLIKIGNALDIYAHVLKARLFDAAGLGSYWPTRNLIRQIRRIKPDVVQLHNIHGYYLNYKLLFKYLNNTDIKVVWTFHDFWAITGHCSHFVEENCDKWQSRCFNCPLVNRYPTSLLDFSERNYKMKKSSFSSSPNLNVVAISNWAQECLAASFICERPISVIHNGVDLSKFRYRKAPCVIDRLENKFIILGVASQWKEGKGFDDFLLLSKSIKDDEAIVLVGLTKRQISILPANVIGFECMDSQEDLAGIYSSADVLLSLSYAETFGMTIVEAAACGTPAIVYDNTGQKDLVTADTGIVVPTGDVGSVYDAIKKIRGKGKDTFREACRARAEKYFDKDKCFEKYVDLYEELIRE